MPSVDEVRQYWNSKPLFSYELENVGSKAFFDQLDEVKRNDVERFSFNYWNFSCFSGKSVLDVGCGPGWITVMYAGAGALVTAVDLTPAAVELTKAHLVHRGLTAVIHEANAEDLPFESNTFDLVVSSGVLHHTPDFKRAITECFRVLRPGGIAKLTFYRKGILHHRFVWPLTRMTMRLLDMRHPGSDMAKNSNSVDDFIRQYDGTANPVGIAMTNSQWIQVLREVGFMDIKRENHFFPVRFLHFAYWIPSSVHKLLDSWFGTMAYFSLCKLGRSSAAMKNS
jgi:ubiquinone/menaquinone biosynthesis C-methylase UbiE